MVTVMDIEEELIMGTIVGTRLEDVRDMQLDVPHKTNHVPTMPIEIGAMV